MVLNPTLKISIHAPHAGRDGGVGFLVEWDNTFQSTRPMRGATFRYPPEIVFQAISILAPHAGRDTVARSVVWTPQPFQSTRPMRGATI